jgi:hypothetical protein
MMAHQLFQALATASIRVKNAKGLDTTSFEAKVHRWATVSIFVLLLVPGALLGELFWMHGDDRAWVPANTALTNWDIIFGIFVSVVAQLGIVVVTGKIAEPFRCRPTTPIREFASMKFPLTVLLVIATGFALNVVAVWVSMVVFDLVLGPLDEPVALPPESTVAPATLGKA